jgi:hypothetical protein
MVGYWSSVFDREFDYLLQCRHYRCGSGAFGLDLLAEPGGRFIFWPAKANFTPQPEVKLI